MLFRSKTPVMTHEVRPAILGGAIVRVGDTVADGSVRRRLSVLRARIATAGNAVAAASSASPAASSA